MTNRNRVIILISSVFVICIGLFIAVYRLELQQGNQIKKTDNNSLFFVSEEQGIGYGITMSNGSVLFKPEFSEIARVFNTVYLRNEESSYLYFLEDGNSIDLGGRESEFYFVHDKQNNILPFYILRYGEEEKTSIYRVFDDKGSRYQSKDYATLNDAFKSINAKEYYIPNKFPDNISTDYNIKETITFPTKDGKSQYIVSTKNQENMYGVIDETGQIMLELDYQNILLIKDSDIAIYAQGTNNSYIYLYNGKIIEVEKDFEFVTTNNYIIQKRGNIVNKIYNLNGDVVVDGIYDIREDIININSENGKSYVMVHEKKGIYELYDVEENIKIEKQYTNVYTNYFKDYGYNVANTSFLYSNNDIFYAANLRDLESYKMNITANIYAPLDMGNIYKINK